MTTNSAIICAAVSAGYFKFLKPGAPVNLMATPVLATIAGCALVPYAYTKIETALPDENILIKIDGQLGSFAWYLTALGVSYGVGYYLNI
jgi:hypothetical protein